MRKKPNRLEIRLQAKAKPPRMSAERYLRELYRATFTGELPRGLEVDLHWRNPDTVSGRSRNWQSDTFEGALESSSDGFREIVRRMIERRLRDK